MGHGFDSRMKLRIFSVLSGDKILFSSLTLSLPNVAKGKFRPNFQISFSKILRNKWHHVKVQAESFHLNGHIIGFRPQTQKLESPYKTVSNTLAVKGLIMRPLKRQHRRF